MKRRADAKVYALKRVDIGALPQKVGRYSGNQSAFALLPERTAGSILIKETPLSPLHVSPRAPKKKDLQDALNEIRILASFKHPRLIRWYETFIGTSTPFPRTQQCCLSMPHGHLHACTEKQTP